MTARTVEETDNLLDMVNEARRERDEAVAERGRATWILSTRDEQFRVRCAELKREAADAIAARDEARRAANLPVDDGSTDTLALAAERSEHAQTREQLRKARQTADREYSEQRAEIDRLRDRVAELLSELDDRDHEPAGMRGPSADLVVVDEMADFWPDYPSAPEIGMGCDLGPDRRSCVVTFAQLLGVGIGAVVLGAASGAGAVVTLLGRWPW